MPAKPDRRDERKPWCLTAPTRARRAKVIAAGRPPRGADGGRHHDDAPGRRPGPLAGRGESRAGAPRRRLRSRRPCSEHAGNRLDVVSVVLHVQDRDRDGCAPARGRGPPRSGCPGRRVRRLPPGARDHDAERGPITQPHRRFRQPDARSLGAPGRRGSAGPRGPAPPPDGQAPRLPLPGRAERQVLQRRLPCRRRGHRRRGRGALRGLCPGSPSCGLRAWNTPGSAIEDGADKATGYVKAPRIVDPLLRGLLPARDRRRPPRAVPVTESVLRGRTRLRRPGGRRPGCRQVPSPAPSRRRDRRSPGPLRPVGPPHAHH